MKRTMLLLIIFVVPTLILGWINLAEAQQAGKVYRIGYLRFGANPPIGPNHVAFRQRLRELGYVEGENLVIEYVSAKGKPERRLEMAKKLVRLKVDVIVTPGAPPLIRAAKQATSTIPIVMAGIFVDPVEAGFVQSLAKPGGNITGITNFETDLHPKRLELLKEAFPQISRAAIIWPVYQQKRGVKSIEAAAQALGIQLQSVVTQQPGWGLGDLEGHLSAISQEHPDGLLVATAGLTLRRKARMRVIEFAAKKRLPTIFARSEFVDEGGLMFYGTNKVHLSRQTATYVGKILKGAKPGDLPVEQPTKIVLVINLKTAKQLGLTIPPSVLYRADKVIK